MRLFTSFEGRISRRTFWFGLLVFVAAGLALSALALPIANWLGPSGRIPLFIAGLPLWYVLMALVVKRLHDRDHKAAPRAWLFAGATLITAVVHVSKIGFTSISLAGRSIEAPGPAAYAVLAACMFVQLWLMVGLGLRQGTRGPNRFGPDPRAPASLPAST